ncbi:hypothetical protein H17ap60334_06399 [Thermosipho africanus H17ap60334]|uniref:hypothetical protein n=1 Tax=Thermosipho africanus TaxID=2421 RepID=UPI00028C7827|nr:hypothetical protein [Thermosipho africanus]EKF49375.1 hypothetical protein H17ap60334_06399 [Thermosipho africanus H17ap60334]
MSEKDIKKSNSSENNYEMNWERYEKALSKVLQNFANRGYEKVTIEELWVETSLPKDLLLELIKERNIVFPEEIKEIKYKNDIIWSSDKE